MTYLPDWEDHIMSPGVVHYGGPVDPEVAIGLGRARGESHAGVAGLTIVDLTVGPSPESPNVKIFSGYSGWSPGQLEAELETDSWFVVDAAPDDVFGDPDGLWRRVLRRQPGSLSIMSLFPDNPRLN